jgi:hypothetical protein
MDNKADCFEANEQDACSVNSPTDTPDEDASFMIRFGGDSERLNCLPIIIGWNYTVRFYQSHICIQ